MKNEEIDRIILTELVKQTGDLGNYILKAIITIYGVSFVALVIGALRYQSTAENGPELTFYALVLSSIIFFALNVALWLLTQTFIRSHIYIARRFKQNLIGTKGSHKSQGRTEELVKFLFSVEVIPLGAKQVINAALLFFSVSILMTILSISLLLVA